MAKGFLLWVWENRTLLKTKTHPPIRSRFNKERQRANVDPRYPELLNRLGTLREGARYLTAELELSLAERAEMLAVPNETYGSFLAESPKRATIPPELKRPA